MCFPHKLWLKEWQIYNNQKHDSITCKEKYHIDKIVPPVAYIYDDDCRHRCFVSKIYNPKALAVVDWKAFHVCVDGGLIRYGCKSYMPWSHFSKKRCDSMVFDDKDLWFIEFKMNTTTCLDNQLWNNFKDGIQQLRDFICNFRCKMLRKRTPLHRYYSLNHQHCTICMERYPLMNTARNTYLEQFRIETGIKVQQMNRIP